MCRWMRSHFQDWIDYNGVAITVFHYIVFLIFRWPYKNYKIHNPKELLRLYPLRQNTLWNILLYDICPLYIRGMRKCVLGEFAILRSG